MLKHAKFIVTAAAAFLLTLTAPAPAAVVFSTFGPGDSYNQLAAFSLNSTQRMAVAVTPTANVYFNTVEAAMYGGLSAVPVKISVVADAAGVPGSTELWSVTGGISDHTIHAFTGPPLLLISGRTYWIVAEALSGGAGWSLTDPAVNGTRAGTASGNWVASFGHLPAVRLTTSATACCNPTTGACSVIQLDACLELGLTLPDAMTCSPALCRACPADFDRNGIQSIDDLFLYINAYFTGCP